MTLIETNCDWLFDMSVIMGEPWPMKATVDSRPSAVSLKVWLHETIVETTYVKAQGDRNSPEGRTL